MDCWSGVIFDQFAANDDGIFEVVTSPWHKGHDAGLYQVLVHHLDRHTFDQDIASFDFVASADNNFLVDAGTFVGTDEVLWFVGDVAFFVLDDDFFSRSFDDFTVGFGQDNLAGVAGGRRLQDQYQQLGLLAESVVLPDAAGYYP